MGGIRKKMKETRKNIFKLAFSRSQLDLDRVESIYGSLIFMLLGNQVALSSPLRPLNKIALYSLKLIVCVCACKW